MESMRFIVLSIICCVLLVFRYAEAMPDGGIDGFGWIKNLMEGSSANYEASSPDDTLGEFSQSLNDSIYRGKRNVFPGYLLRNMDSIGSSQAFASNKNSKWLEGTSHYRLVPGLWLKGMNYHFDGLATVIKFEFKDGKLLVNSRAFRSEVFHDPKGCIIFGTGNGPTLGHKVCFQNPVVNLLPINNQLWLTIDTYAWGRIDPETLETIPAETDIHVLTLNAHPACDYLKQECFVQHPFSRTNFPLTNEVCVSKLKTTDKNLEADRLSCTKSPKNMLLQHSHSPCVTPNYVISKLDYFGKRDSTGDYVEGGLLKQLHQVSDNLWMVMDRNSQKSRILTSNMSFVNNHFWNCYEDDKGYVVVESVAATDSYLDAYFEKRLEKQAQWKDMFLPAQRCKIPVSENDKDIECFQLLENSEELFDYPTFNPYYKMRKDYKYFYGIGPKTSSSKFFDRLIKISAKEGKVLKEFTKDGFYFTEADFISRGKLLPEDDGALLTVAYDSNKDVSHLLVLNAKTLELLDSYELGQVIPFHAHGIICRKGEGCFTNP